MYCLLQKLALKGISLLLKVLFGILNWQILKSEKKQSLCQVLIIFVSGQMSLAFNY